MVVLKFIGKILLVPVWIVVVMSWLLVKAIVAAYSFARGSVAFGLGALILGTVICYQDWKQVMFLLCIVAITFLILFVGVFIEVSLESVKSLIGEIIIQ